MRIAFVIPSFGPGGAERVGSLLCNFWSNQGHAVTAITFEAPLTKSFHALDSRVGLHPIEAVNATRNLAGRLSTNARRLVRLRAEFRAWRPDIVVAFTTEANLAAVSAGYRLGIPIVLSERNQPNRPGLGRVAKAARRLLYSSAAALVLQTEEMAGWARSLFRTPTFVIPNPVLFPALRVSKRSGDTGFKLVAVGRLVPQKGYDLLVDGFASLADAHQDWKLFIYGEGPERVSLESRIRKHGLANRVSLPGLREDIAAVLADADLFVHPSRYEGYPNALMEALASGCPVVASASPGGTTEILGSGTYGLLVPVENVEALSLALARMMSNPALRKRYAKLAPAAVDHLRIEIIGARWMELLASLCQASTIQRIESP